MMIRIVMLSSAILAAASGQAAADPVFVPGLGWRMGPCCIDDPQQPRVYVPGPFDRPAIGPYYRGDTPGPNYAPPLEPHAGKGGKP